MASTKTFTYEIPVSFDVPPEASPEIRALIARLSHRAALIDAEVKCALARLQEDYENLLEEVRLESLDAAEAVR